ncbi:MAG: hypothetical protein WCO26_07705 [Deltaproteobacteria bacterium]
MIYKMQVSLGPFGRGYTHRNDYRLQKREAMYKKKFGTTRTEINQRFLGNMDRSISILEVGSNLGIQLLCLQRMGFSNLYGVELQMDAIRRSKRISWDMQTL